jgi:DNA-directed RNA polymerase subunit RPC12/RpoP
MSDISFDCPNCQKPLVIDEQGAGMTIKCPDCSHAIVVPQKPPAAHPYQPPPPEPPDASRHKACPFCGEQILSVAKKCKHCGEFLKQKRRRSDQAHGTPTPLPPDASTVANTDRSLSTTSGDSKVTFKCIRCRTMLESSAEDVGKVVICCVCGDKRLVPSPQEAEYINSQRPVAMAFMASGIVCFLVVGCSLVGVFDLPSRLFTILMIASSILFSIGLMYKHD